MKIKNQGFLSKASEMLEGFQDDCWSLLVLERDLTLMTADGASFDKNEVNALKKRYAELSIKVFGQVRADRQYDFGLPVEPLVKSEPHKDDDLFEADFGLPVEPLVKSDPHKYDHLFAAFKSGKK